MKRFSYKDEQDIYDALLGAGFIVLTEIEHESRLDFTVDGVGIEYKSYHSPRAIEQMARVQDGILVQGPKAAQFLVSLLRNQKKAA